MNYYSPLAVNLLHGNGYSVSGQFVTVYPPGFPLFLALIYKITGYAGTENAVYPWAAALLQAFSCGFIYLCARLYLLERTAVTAALLLACYPFFMLLGVTEYVWTAMPLFLSLFFSASFFYLKTRLKKTGFLLIFSGLLFGAASLVWPGGSYLWAVMAILGLSFQFQPLKKTLWIAVFTGAFWVLPAFWHGYVMKATGKSVWFSENLVGSMKDGLIRHEGSKLRNFETAKDGERLNQAGYFKTSGDFIRFYFEELQTKPNETIRFILFKLFRPWYATDSEKHEPWIFLIQIPYLFLGFWGAVYAIRQRPFLTVFSGMVIVYFWLVSFSVLSILRYMMPAMGFVMIWTAVSIEAIAGSIRGIKNEKI